MSTDLNSSFVEQYVNINTKLKKRFMRKPNLSEATNEFNGLAIQCEHSEQPSFAGHAYIGAAKCEATAGNFLGEAEYYLAAARQFMKAELKLYSLKFHSPTRENLEAAIGTYIQALNKYPEGSALRSSILMELANNLVLLDHKLEAITYYEEALKAVGNTSMLGLKCLTTLLSLNVQREHYDIALETANTICDSNITVPEDTLTDIQITRILLALVVEPASEKKTPSLEKLFTDLLNDCEVPFSTDLRLKLQSIIICNESRDLESLVDVSADMDMFTLQQKELLHALIRKMEKCL